MNKNTIEIELSEQFIIEDENCKEIVIIIVGSSNLVSYVNSFRHFLYGASYYDFIKNACGIKNVYFITALDEKFITDDKELYFFDKKKYVKYPKVLKFS